MPINKRIEKPITCVQHGILSMSPSINWICSDPVNWGDLEVRLDLSYANEEFQLMICSKEGGLISKLEVPIDQIFSLIEASGDYHLTADEVDLAGIKPVNGVSKYGMGTDTMPGNIAWEETD